jgi:aminopeptidase N
MAHTEKDRVLLPTNAIPVHYDLHLTPSFQTFTFEGKEQIRIKVLKQTNTITVHAVDIKFYSVKIEFPNKQRLDAKAIHVLPGRNFFFFLRFIS